MQTSRHASRVGVFLSAVLWVMPALSAAEEPASPAFPPAESTGSGPQEHQPSGLPQGGRLSSPLMSVPQQWQKASREEGPIVGVWRALTVTDQQVAPTPPPASAPGKPAKPRPLSLREYLNQQGTEQAPSGQLLELGF